jgi:hypothetical protein
MNDVEGARADPPRHRIEHVAIECVCLVLLRRITQCVASRELGWIDLVPDLDIAAGDVCVPVADSAARDRDETIAVESKRGLDPLQERDPVERLEADFREPWPRDEQPTAADQRLDLALDPPLGQIEAPLFVELLPPPLNAPKRTPHASKETLGGVDTFIAQALARLTGCMRGVLHGLGGHFERPAGCVARALRLTHRLSISARSALPHARRTTSTARVSSSTNAPQRRPVKTRFATSR